MSCNLPLLLRVERPWETFWETFWPFSKIQAYTLIFYQTLNLNVHKQGLYLIWKCIVFSCSVEICFCIIWYWAVCLLTSVLQKPEYFTSDHCPKLINRIKTFSRRMAGRRGQTRNCKWIWSFNQGSFDRMVRQIPCMLTDLVTKYIYAIEL